MKCMPSYINRPPHQPDSGILCVINKAIHGRWILIQKRGWTVFKLDNEMLSFFFLTRSALSLFHHRITLFVYSKLSSGGQGNAPLRLPALQPQPTTCPIVVGKQEQRQARDDIMPSRDFARLFPRASALWTVVQCRRNVSFWFVWGRLCIINWV